MNNIEEIQSPTIAEEVEVELDLEPYFKHGLHAIRYLNFNEAIEIFETIIDKHPNVLEAYINLGTAYFKTGKLQEAINVWKKALEKDSNLITCYANVGNAYKKLGNIFEALKSWYKVVFIAPDHDASMINLAVAYEELGNLSFAMKFYELYLTHGISKRSAHYKRINAKVYHQKKIGILNLRAGLKYQRREELRKAAQAYLKSIEAYPNLFKAQINMGSICYKAGKLENAVHYWLNAYKLEPDFATNICNLGIAYDKLKKYSYAFCFYTKYIEKINLDENSQEFYEINLRLQQINEYIKKKHTDITDSHFQQAEEFSKNMQFEDAIIEYENYKILKPAAIENTNNKINELKDFINPVKKAAKTTLEIGDICLKKNKIPQAIIAYERCLSFDENGELGKTAKQKLEECAKLRNNSKFQLKKA